MSENVLVTPLFHQRSHSMPVGHGFINNGDNNNNKREFDYKRSSPLKNETSNNSITSSTTTTSTATTTSDMFPLPMPKSIASQLNNSSSTMIDTKDEPNFFCKPNTLLPIFDYNNRKVENYPIMFNCKMDRGFFTCQSHWTCYRRNYFQVTASFVIQGHSEGTCYALQLNDKPMQPIQQFFLRLKACTSSAGSSTATTTTTTATATDIIIENQNMIRPVALTQMTPKRDKGPQREPPLKVITPADTVFGCEQVCVTFERLQFRVATANNGKRRASQQYFRLIFELIAQLNDNSQHVVSECYSSPLVVRGRSPGHYSSDTPTTTPTPTGTGMTERKRKTTLSPNTAIHLINKEDEEKQESKRIATTAATTTLPQPQYLFSPPTMVMDHQPHHPHHHQQQQQQHHHHHPQAVETTTSSNYNIMPIMTPSSYNNNNNNSSAFSNFHNRSQSANDTQFYTRNRHQQQQMKYPMLDQENDELFEPYQINMARELRNWQQVVHQRNDSNATFDSFDNSNNRTRPATPIPYHNYSNNNNDNSSHSNPWSTTTTTTNTTTTSSQQQYHHHHHV